MKLPNPIIAFLSSAVLTLTFRLLDLTPPDSVTVYFLMWIVLNQVRPPNRDLFNNKSP